MLGDRTGADALLDALRHADWDHGQDIITAGQSGANYSRVDMLILALGRSRDPRATVPISEKAKKLDAQSGLSHVRVVGAGPA